MDSWSHGGIHIDLVFSSIDLFFVGGNYLGRVISMRYQTAWDENREWLKSGISHLKEKINQEDLPVDELNRLKGKLDGVTTALSKVDELNTVHKLCSHPNITLDEDIMYCPDCNGDFLELAMSKV